MKCLCASCLPLGRRSLLAAVAGAGIGAATFGKSFVARAEVKSPARTLSRSTLIRGGFIYTADVANTAIPDGWVHIEGGTIKAVGKRGEVEPVCEAIIDARGKMVLPGFVNAHWHESFVEGPDRAKPDDSDLQRTPFSLGGDIEALSSYFGVIADVCHKLKPDEALAIARWSMWTQLRSGTTALGDIGSLNSTDAMAQAAIDLGMRIRVSRWGSDIMIPKGATRFKRIADVDAQAKDWDDLMAKWNNHASGLVGGMPTILAAFGSSDEQLIAMRDVAKKYNSPYAAHLAPLKNENAALQPIFGRTAIGRFESLGLLTDRLLAVHTAYADEAEYRLLVKSGVKICYAPANYGLLGETTVSETGQMGRLLKDNVPVSSSTDGNISYTGGMPEAMRSAYLSVNEASNDNTACTPTLALKTGTRHGAIGLGWGDKIGSIEIGKQADLVIVNIDDWRYRLVSHPLATFLVSGGSKDVETVLVAGNVVVKDGQPTHISEDDMLRDYQAAVVAARVRIFGQ